MCPKPLQQWHCVSHDLSVEFTEDALGAGTGLLLASSACAGLLLASSACAELLLASGVCLGVAQEVGCAHLL
jgi:hypothetical protein